MTPCQWREVGNVERLLTRSVMVSPSRQRRSGPGTWPLTPVARARRAGEVDRYLDREVKIAAGQLGAFRVEARAVGRKCGQAREAEPGGDATERKPLHEAPPRRSKRRWASAQFHRTSAIARAHRRRTHHEEAAERDRAPHRRTGPARTHENSARDASRDRMRDAPLRRTGARQPPERDRLKATPARASQRCPARRQACGGRRGCAPTDASDAPSAWDMIRDRRHRSATTGTAPRSAHGAQSQLRAAGDVDRRRVPPRTEPHDMGMLRGHLRSASGVAAVATLAIRRRAQAGYARPRGRGAHDASQTVAEAGTKHVHGREWLRIGRVRKAPDGRPRARLLRHDDGRRIRLAHRWVIAMPSMPAISPTCSSIRSCSACSSR